MSVEAASTGGRARRRPVARGRPSWIARRLRQRLVVALLSALAAVALRLPDRFLHRASQVLGVVYYLLARERRDLVRANLERTCRGLVALGLADAPTAAAARDHRALERLVRSAFGHYLRSYLEMLLTSRYDVEYVRERVVIETPEAVERAFAPGGGRIFLGLHFGAIEMPGIYVVHRAGRPVTAPMEIVANPLLQAWLERTRGYTGVRVIPIRDARRHLREVLARGEIAGLIADRDLLGNGLPVTIFGAPTTLPAGAAILAYETGAPVYPAAVRRTGFGSYAARLLELEPPPRGPLRPWLHSFVERQARAYEELIASAPEQWWAIFFPLWPDLPGNESRSAGGAHPE
ncbi:MAG TPA: lysophospholipid acyltransferase family protein [Candidatus Limnocylindrales bacterium]|jgi:KDO2-lipid IV(A) lauroyltransferase|nr:lysophospholipid acyltransferase family protein [Candidatus Limnocylindrales bacterium]